MVRRRTPAQVERTVRAEREALEGMAALRRQPVDHRLANQRRPIQVDAADASGLTEVHPPVGTELKPVGTVQA